MDGYTYVVVSAGSGIETNTRLFLKENLAVEYAREVAMRGKNCGLYRLEAKYEPSVKITVESDNATDASSECSG